MEITTWTMYLFTRLDAIKLTSSLVWLFALIFLLAAVAVLIIEVDNDDQDSVRKGKTFIMFTGTIFTLAFLTNILVPNQKEMAAIYVIPKIVDSDFVQELPAEVSQLAKEWLQELKTRR